MSVTSPRATYLPTSYLASLPPTAEISMSTLVAEQDRLADEAKEAMPYAFDECSYGKGYLRQSVWSCIDCGYKGVCYGCSISCHSDHTLVELWTRRSFRCDCPTDCVPRIVDPNDNGQSTSSPGPDEKRPTKRQRCSLNPETIQPASPNERNRYTKNYRGEFCRCGRKYDPLEETEGMLCCIGCEDWFHESCLNLRQPRTQPLTHPTQAVTQSAGADPSSTWTPNQTIEANGDGDAEDADDDDEKGILIPSDSYDCLICGQCVEGNTYLRLKAGQEGCMIIEPDGEGFEVVRGRKEEPVQVIKKEAIGINGPGRGEVDSELPPREEEKEAGAKRKVMDMATSERQPDIKRLKPDPDGEGKGPDCEGVRYWRGKGDIFLSHGVRDRLNSELEPDVVASLPFPLQDEEIYEPPKDEDREETLDEVTARVVDTLPRVQAIEALHGYQRIKDRLQVMLASHAQTGTVVSREDVEAMFAELRNGS